MQPKKTASVVLPFSLELFLKTRASKTTRKDRPKPSKTAMIRSSISSQHSVTESILSENEITSQEIIEIHADILRDFGGTPGIRDTGTLDYVIYQVNQSKKTVRKSAIILHGIATGHPFIDGNKRTAFVAADNQVRDQGHLISATDDDVVSFMLEVAEYKHTRESVEEWLKEKTGL